MKKKILVAGAIAGVMTSASYAQSSVTLYGIVDAGFVYNNNSGGKKLYATSAGNMQGDRWGLRGTEDLGGGLRTVFAIENGFNVFTGRLNQGGDEFGRQAYVGIATTQYGTVTIGRQYDSVVDYTGALEAGSQWATLYGDHPGDLDNMNNSNRVNNSIKYASANYSGLTFGALYSLGGLSGQFSKNQIWSAGVGYARGPLVLGAGYLNVKNPNYSFFGNNASSSTTASNMTGSTVYSGYATAKTQQIITVGGAYTFGPATVGATYSNTQFKDLGETAVAGAGQVLNGSAKFHNAEINFKYQVTATLLLGAAYDYTKGYGVNSAKYHQGVIGADYFLSKRTDVYIDGVYQHALGTDSTRGAAVANIVGLSASSTSNQVAIVVGMRHKF